MLLYITDFSSQIAPEAISENPNLQFSQGGCPQTPPKRAQGMEACPCILAPTDGLQRAHYYLVVSSPGLYL